MLVATLSFISRSNVNITYSVVANAFNINEISINNAKYLGRHILKETILFA